MAGLTDSEQAEIVRVYTETRNQIKTAKLTHHSSATVSKYLIALGYGRGQGGNPVRKIEDEVLIAESKFMTRNEIAEKHNMHITSVDRNLRRLGISCVRADGKEHVEYGRYKDEYIAEEIKRISKGTLTLIDYRTGNGARHYDVVCNVCGERFTIGKYKFTHNSCNCPNCEKRDAEDRREKEKLKKDFTRVVRLYLKTRIPRVCEKCGKTFFSQYDNQKYCSKACQKKIKHRKRDKRIPKERVVDKGITVKLLYKRDNGKCYLCGGECDFDDWRIAETGNKYPGDNYPTIDHVIPISRGGFESWENVRLAHWKCNLRKSDFIVEVPAMSTKMAYSERYHPPTKKTAQYTLDGNLIKVWDSTAQIRRELGLNDKHIQNVCRGDKSNTGNAFGYHWEYI